MAGICTDSFAEPTSDEDIKDYIEKIKKLQEEGWIPDLEKQTTYKVYSLKGRSFGAHHSIVLTANDKNFFTVELVICPVDGENRIFPLTRKLTLSPDDKPKLIYHGQLKTSGEDLISKVIATMKKFGNYFKLFNNCQDFCNNYLDAIGLGHQKTLVDSDRVVLGFFLVVVILLVLFIFYAILTNVLVPLPIDQDCSSLLKWIDLHLIRV